jgi:DNA-directed RNA polymerase subunit omega
MHRPSISEILKQGESYYSLVVAVAKRAREIAMEAEEKGEVLSEKPVQLAVKQFASGEYKLVEPKDSDDKTE